MTLSRLICLSLVAAVMAGCVSSEPQRGRESSPDESAAAYNIQLGLGYLHQGNYALARDKLERALKQNPREPNVHTSLALLYDRTDDNKRAEKHFREALRLAPDNPDISNNYAVYLCKHKRVAEGVARFETVAANRFYRTPEVALTNAGVCLRDAQKLDEAQAKFAAAIKARPNYSEATVQLAHLLMVRNRLADARTTVDTYLNAFKPNPDVLLSAVAVARAGKDRLAEEKYARRLRSEFPDSEQAKVLQRNER